MADIKEDLGKFSLFLVISFLVGCSHQYLHSEDQNRKIDARKVFTSWRIEGFKAANITAISSEQAQTYVGDEIVLTRDNARYFGENCDDVHYKYEHVSDVDKFLGGFKVSKRHLGIQAVGELNVVDVRCDNYEENWSISLMVSSDMDVAMVYDRGFFFFVVPA